MSGGGSRYSDDVRFEIQTFVDQGGKPISVIVRGEIADVDVTSMHIPEVPQALKESVESRRPRLQCARIERQEAEPRDVLGLLSFASARRGEQGGEEASGDCPEERTSVHHSIT
jgi:hypothetical protein